MWLSGWSKSPPRAIDALQEQLRAMFAAREFDADVGIADRLAELDLARR